MSGISVRWFLSVTLVSSGVGVIPSSGGSGKSEGGSTGVPNTGANEAKKNDLSKTPTMASTPHMKKPNVRIQSV